MSRFLAVALVMLVALTGCQVSEADLDRLFAQMLTPTGKAVADWESNGLDWRAHMVVDGQPQVFFDNDKAMPDVTIFGAAAPAPPPGWVEHTRLLVGKPPGTQRQTDFVRIGPDTLLAFGVDYTLRGNALCIPAGSGAELVLMRPASKAGEPVNADETAARYLAERYHSKLFANELCVTLKQSAKGYKLAYFDGEGRPLGRLARGSSAITRHGSESVNTLLGLAG